MCDGCIQVVVVVKNGGVVCTTSHQACILRGECEMVQGIGVIGAVVATSTNVVINGRVVCVIGCCWGQLCGGGGWWRCDVDVVWVVDVGKV